MGTENIAEKLGRFGGRLPPVAAEGEESLTTISFKKWMDHMKHIGTMALILNLGVAGLYAHEKPVNMSFSGTEGPSAINLQFPGTSTGEFNFGGKGSLGRFSFRNVEANVTLPQPSGSCPANQVYFQTLAGAGAGVFRFQDESLLTVKLQEGFDCIDFAALNAHCTRIFEITGGTGRFKNASGTLTLTETARPVADALNKPTLPVFFIATGEFTGSIAGVAEEEEGSGERP